MAGNLDNIAAADNGSGRGFEDLAEQASLLVERIALLRGEDRLLMTMYVNNHNSCRQIARLMGLHVGTVARRLRRLSHLLLAGEYITCLRHRDELTSRQLRLARDYFMRQLSIRELAARYKCSRYLIRQMLSHIYQVVHKHSK